MTDHPNINQFSATIFAQRYDYFKFFAETYFHDSFWPEVLKREKKSTNKLIAFFYIINHKCHTEKDETIKITYKSLKKFIGNDYTLNEFSNIFDDCHLNSGSFAMFVPFLKLGQKKIFKDFEDDYMKFEINTFNNAEIIGDTVIFQIPKSKKPNKNLEKILIKNLEEFFGVFFDNLKDNSLITKLNFFEEIDGNIKVSDDLMLIARFYGIFICFSEKHTDDLEFSDNNELYNKSITLLCLAMNKHFPKKEESIFDYFQKIRFFSDFNPNWQEENLDGQYYLQDKFEEGYNLYEEYYFEKYGNI